MRIYRIEDISGKGFYNSRMLISRETYQYFHGPDHPEIWSDHIDDLNTISLKYKIMERSTNLEEYHITIGIMDLILISK